MYLGLGHGSPVLLVHAATAPNAVRHVLPVLPPEQIAADRPDYVLVLPWNLRTELTEQLSYVREWGGRLVFPIPTLEVV